MKMRILLTVVLFSGLLSGNLSAQIVEFTDNFDARTDEFDGFNPWNAFSDNAGFPGGYFIQEPSTSGPQISALATEDGTSNKYLNFYANYDNRPVHNRDDPAQNPSSPNAREAISFFVEQSFTAADTASGETWFFDFDYASNPAAPITGDTEVGAFIRVFDPAFNLLGGDTFDTGPGATAAFQAAETLSVTLDPNWTEGIIQFGFTNITGNDNGSGRFYDNVRFSNVAVPEPSSLALLGISGLAFMTRRRRNS